MNLELRNFYQSLLTAEEKIFTMIVATLVLCCQTRAYSSPVSFYRVLEIPFLDSTFKLGTCAVQESPPENCFGVAQLVTLRLPNGQLEFLRNLNSLAGKVTIRSGSEALSYARLRTSPALYSCWFRWLEQPIQVEIFDRTAIPDDLHFESAGDARFYADKKASPEGNRGFVCHSTFRKFFTPATAVEVAKEFAVTRDIVLWRSDVKPKSLEICQVKELVTRDGHYMRIKVRQLRKVPNVEWVF